MVHEIRLSSYLTIVPGMVYPFFRWPSSYLIFPLMRCTWYTAVRGCVGVQNCCTAVYAHTYQVPYTSYVLHCCRVAVQRTVGCRGTSLSGSGLSRKQRDKKEKRNTTIQDPRSKIQDPISNSKQGFDRRESVTGT